MNRHPALDSPLAHTAVAGLLGFILVVAAPFPVSAQTAPSSPAARPRIGLALGGGAARGLAHIGVLKWFEEHRIPIDAIAGTSMGGLIGGAFATGMTPAEIERLVSSLSWEQMLAPGASFADKAFRRKQDARDFPSRLEFGLRGGFSLPAGLSASPQIDLLLGRIAMPYYATTSFDQFPTPFRCVAADLKSAEAVVFDRGGLAQALRATMATPGVFAPVTVDGRTLVDGGILNNVPADVVSAMGADIVIAVDVSGDLAYEKRGDSLLSVLVESLDVMMRAGSRRALESADIVLVPALKGFWAVDFDRADQFARQGYAAAEAQRSSLEKYALSPVEYEAYRAARAGLRRTRLPAPAFVDVEGVLPDEAATIRARLERFVLQPLDTAALDRQMVAMMGTERYLSVTYRLVVDGERVGIAVTARPKTYGPPFLLTALDLQNTQSTGVAATLRGRVWTSGLTGHGSEARLDVAAGTIMRAAGEWYQPVGHGGLFVSSYAGVEEQQFNVFEGRQFRAEYRRTVSTAGVDAGFTMGNVFEWRAGYAAEHLDGLTLVGTGVLPASNGSQRYVRLQATYDGQSGPTIPDRGLYAQGRIRRFTHVAGATSTDLAVSPRAEPDNLLSGEADASVFMPVSRAGRVFVRAAGGSSFGSTAQVNAFALGGPFLLSALNVGELRGSNYVLATAGYFHRVYRFAQGAGGIVYAGGWVENGATFERWSGAMFKTDVSGGFVVDTPLGPISAGASVGFDGRLRLFAGLGQLMHR
ncbi:MAG: patatin-like phospholipase family protein [Acidobacteria bacterium]|nr:patatin-like phospholipase family protein [Acidobacteriota bacterium]